MSVLRTTFVLVLQLGQSASGERWLVVAGAGFARGAATGPTPIRFLFTSDAHYGLHRAQFRGRTDVDAQTVNRALVAAMNDVGRLVGPIDFIVKGGDVSNRE